MLPKRLDGIEAGIALPQLCELMDRKLALQEPHEQIRRAFRAFDSGAKGFISLGTHRPDAAHRSRGTHTCDPRLGACAGEFVEVMADVAPHMMREMVTLIFDQVDADRDGRVCFRDFDAIAREVQVA